MGNKTRFLWNEVEIIQTDSRGVELAGSLHHQQSPECPSYITYKLRGRTSEVIAPRGDERCPASAGMLLLFGLFKALKEKNNTFILVFCRKNKHETTKDCCFQRVKKDNF